MKVQYLLSELRNHFTEVPNLRFSRGIVDPLSQLIGHRWWVANVEEEGLDMCPRVQNS
jgi:hypothetical protein